MPLNLNDLLKKAEKKGITSQPLRHWQEESVLYANKNPQQHFSQTKTNFELSASEENLDSISNQLVINKEPISNQLVTRISNQLVINKEPISNPLVTNKKREISNREPISKRISNRNKEPISNQLVTELVTKQLTVSKITGIQRKILFYIIEDCIYRGKLASGFLTNETFRNITNTTANTVKTAIQRLIKKGLLKREIGQRGQGGFSSFIITQEIREAVLKEKRNPSISNQLVSALVTNISNQLVTNKEAHWEPNTSSSSSSLKDLKTTTTELCDEWNFDITPYARFGFTTSQLKQLASLRVISAINVEQSLIEFSYDLDNNALPAIKTGKINFLMGLLRVGHSYVSEGFKNEQEAMILEMARRAEDKRKNLLEAKFGAWEVALSDEERKEIENKLPTHLTILHRTYGTSNVEVKNWLFDYYLQKHSM